MNVDLGRIARPDTVDVVGPGGLNVLLRDDLVDVNEQQVEQGRFARNKFYRRSVDVGAPGRTVQA
jgi:hypothetical protein